MPTTLELPPPYKKQHEAICDPARIVIIEASTKSGKTAGCLVWLLQQAWNNGLDNHNFWWVAPIYAQAKNIGFARMKAMLRQADPNKQIWDSHDSDLYISLWNGAKIWFKGSDNADSLYGDDVYAAVIDEATRCREDAWIAVRSTLTATKGPVRIIGNVKGRRNWAYLLARMAEGGASDMAYHKLTAYDAVDGGVLDLDEIESAKRILPDHVFRELYLAEPSDDGGNPFGIQAISDCTGQISNQPAVVFGVDLAKSVDFTAVIGLDDEGRVSVCERWQGTDWKTTIEKIGTLIGECPTLVDSTGVGDPVVEELQRGSPFVEGFKFSSTSKQQLMEGLAQTISKRELTYPDNWLRTELDIFEFEHTRTGVKYSAPQGQHDDGVCALALAVRAKVQNVNRFSFKVF
jgi:phage FluMu gp28-like protein